MAFEGDSRKLFPESEKNFKTKYDKGKKQAEAQMCMITESKYSQLCLRDVGGQAIAGVWRIGKHTNHPKEQSLICLAHS
jgi:hypothetical protein